METYRKERTVATKTTTSKKQQRKIKDDKVEAIEAAVVQNVGKEDQALNVEITDTNVKKVTEGAKIAEIEVIH